MREEWIGIEWKGVKVEEGKGMKCKGIGGHVGYGREGGRESIGQGGGEFPRAAPAVTARSQSDPAGSGGRPK